MPMKVLLTKRDRLAFFLLLIILSLCLLRVEAIRFWLQDQIFRPDAVSCLKQDKVVYSFSRFNSVDEIAVVSEHVPWSEILYTSDELGSDDAWLHHVRALNLKWLAFIAGEKRGRGPATTQDASCDGGRIAGVTYDLLLLQKLLFLSSEGESTHYRNVTRYRSPDILYAKRDIDPRSERIVIFFKERILRCRFGRHDFYPWPIGSLKLLLHDPDLKMGDMCIVGSSPERQRGEDAQQGLNQYAPLLKAIVFLFVGVGMSIWSAYRVIEADGSLWWFSGFCCGLFFSGFGMFFLMPLF